MMQRMKDIYAFRQKSLIACLNNKTIKKQRQTNTQFWSGRGLTFMLCYSNLKWPWCGGGGYAVTRINSAVHIHDHIFAIKTHLPTKDTDLLLAHISQIVRVVCRRILYCASLFWRQCHLQSAWLASKTKPYHLRVSKKTPHVDRIRDKTYPFLSATNGIHERLSRKV